MVELKDILAARSRLTPYLMPTPLERAPGLGETVWLKLENVNLTHSFKVRPALNALLSLQHAQRAGGVVVASSGNFAQGVACAAALTGTPAAIFMPAASAQRKINGVRRWGAEPILTGGYYDEAERAALEFAREDDLPYVSPYNHPAVVAGGGTVGLEIAEQMSRTVAGVYGMALRVLVPVGGGGLISGISVALKTLYPQIEIVGVNVEGAPDMYNHYYAAALPLNYDTLAEALPGQIEADSITLDLTRRHVDRLVLVHEAEVAAAMRWLLSEQGWLVEGGGAVGVAALLGGQVALDRPTVVVITGSNVDADVITRVLGTNAD